MKRKLLSLILVVSMIFGLGTACVSAASFEDVPAGAWYEQGVNWCVENDIMSGMSEREFSPGGQMSRAMLAAVLYRASGRPSSGAGTSFGDVSQGKWYSAPVAWASENKYISGYDNGLFGVDDPVTREQIAAILWRYAGSPRLICRKFFC